MRVRRPGGMILGAALLLTAATLWAEPSATIFGGKYLHRDGPNVAVQIQLEGIVAIAAELQVVFLDYFGDEIIVEKRVGHAEIHDSGTFIYTGFPVDDSSLIDKVDSFAISVVTPDRDVVTLPTTVTVPEVQDPEE